MTTIKRSPLILVVALCIAIRLGVLVALPSVFAFEQTGAIHGDEAYDVYAQNLIKIGEFGRVPGVPDTAFPPLYAYTLAVVYGIFGRGHYQVGIYHILLDVLSIVLLFEISRRLIKRGELVGLLAGVFYALYPYLIFQNLTVIDTPLYMTLSFAFLLLIVLLRERPSWDRYASALVILSGMVLGLLALSRPAFVVLLPFVVLWLLFTLRFDQVFTRLFVVGLISLIVMSPWVVHNYRAFHALIPVASNGAANFYIGNNPNTVPFIRAGYHPQFVPVDGTNDPYAPIPGSDLLALSLRYLRENPSAIPQLWWTKFLAYWSINVFPSKNPGAGIPIVDRNGEVRITTDAQGNLDLNGIEKGDPITAYSQPLFNQIGRTVHVVYFGGLLILGVIGLALSIAQWREVSLLWFSVLSMTLVYVVIVPATRYRAPTDPILFLFSAYSLIVLWEKLRGGLRQKRSPR